MNQKHSSFLGVLMVAGVIMALVVGIAAADTKPDPSDELFVPASYWVASGGPDGFGYSYADSDGGNCVYDWIEGPDAAAWVFPDADDSTLLIPIGFDFTFYGRTYSELTVDSNGALLLEARSSDWVNHPLGEGTLSPRLAPFWDDLVVEAVRVQSRGTAPERSLVITFLVQRPAGLAFQVLVSEGGEIRYQYRVPAGLTEQGEGATVGIQGPTTGLGYLFNGFPAENRLHDALAVCFLPPDGIYLSPSLQRRVASAGRIARYTVTAVNQTGAAGVFSFEVASEWAASVSPVEAHLPAGQALDLTIRVEVPAGVAGEQAPAIVTMAGPNGAQTLARLETRRGSGEYGYTGASTNDSLAVFDLATHSLVTITNILPEGDYPYDASFRGDESEVWIAGASGDGVVVVETVSQTISHRISQPGLIEYPVDVLFSKYGDEAYISSRATPAQIAVVDTETYAVTGVITVPTEYLGPGKMTLNPCSGEIYMANWYDNHLFVIDPFSRTVTTDLVVGDSMWDLVMDPTAQTLYVTDRGSDQVHVFGANPLTLITSIAVGGDPWGIDITPDGRLLFVTNEDDSNVSVIDTALNVVTSTIPLPGAAPRDVDISADGGYAYVPSGSITGDDAVFVIDTQTWQVVDTIYVAPASNPNVVAIAPLLANLDPIASFVSNSPVTLGSTAVFTDTSRNDPSWWYWDFGDNLGNSTEQNPTYSYSNAGTYTVTLTAGSDCGSDQIAEPFLVEPGALIYLPAIVRSR